MINSWDASIPLDDTPQRAFSFFSRYPVTAGKKPWRLSDIVEEIYWDGKKRDSPENMRHDWRVKLIRVICRCRLFVRLFDG